MLAMGGGGSSMKIFVWFFKKCFALGQFCVIIEHGFDLISTKINKKTMTRFT
jgi:hypothetical protein